MVMHFRLRVYISRLYVYIYLSHVATIPQRISQLIPLPPPHLKVCNMAQTMTYVVGA